MPEVSVVIPTYNDALTLKRCIQSVLDQTWCDLEILVVDDGSTDNTQEVLAEYREPVISIFQENQERSAARNTGIHQAKGEFIAFLDADDTWMPNKLEKQMKAFRDDPRLDMVYSKAYLLDETSSKLGLTGSFPELEDGETFYCRLLLGNFIPSMTPVIRRQHCERIGGFDPELRQGEDWDYWLRLVRKGKVYCIPEALACYYVSNQKNLLKKMTSRHVHKAYVHIIEKNRAVSRCSDSVINLALALVKLDCAVVEVGLSNNESGRVFFSQAIEIEPKLFTTYTILAENRIANLVQQNYLDFSMVQDGVHLIKRFLSIMPQSISSISLQRKTISRLYANYFFRAAQVGNNKSLRRSLFPMLFYDPGIVMNRGVWSLFFHSFTQGLNLLSRP